MVVKMKLKMSEKMKRLGIGDGTYWGRIDEAEFSIEISESKDGGDIPIIIKDGYIYIPDDVVSRVHLNADQEREVDLAPADDYEKRYSKDRFAIVII